MYTIKIHKRNDKKVFWGNATHGISRRDRVDIL